MGRHIRKNIYCCLIVEEETNLWYRQLTNTLRQMDYEVFVPPKIGLRESWHLMGRQCWGKQHQSQLTERILNDVKTKQKKYGIDLFFCYLYPFQFKPDLFTELDKLGIPSLYFFCDNLTEKDVAAKYAPYATLNWVPEIDAVKQFQVSKSKYIYLPMAANPSENYPVDTEKISDLAFLGTSTPYRRDLLGKVLTAGLDLKIYGSGWRPGAGSYHALEQEKKTNDMFKVPRMAKWYSFMKFKRQGLSVFLKHGLSPKVRTKKYNSLGLEFEAALGEVVNKKPLSYDDYNRVFSFSAITTIINDSFDRYLKDSIIKYTKLKNFEAAIAGACLLTERTSDISELFEEGKEIMIFSTHEELIDKAKFLLKNESIRRRMRKAIYKRALSEHTWQHRFKKAFSEMKLI